MPLFDKTFYKFILVGIINTIVGASLMFILYNIAGVGYWYSSAANYIVGSLLSFFLNKYWTFQVRKWSVFLIITFVVNIVISYFLAYKLARTALYFALAEHPQEIRDNVAMFAGMCLFTALNYLGQRYVVFNHKKY